MTDASCTEVLVASEQLLMHTQLPQGENPYSQHAKGGGSIWGSRANKGIIPPINTVQIYSITTDIKEEFSNGKIFEEIRNYWKDTESAKIPSIKRVIRYNSLYNSIPFLALRQNDQV